MLALTLTSTTAHAGNRLHLGPDQPVAAGGNPILVPGYSVPSLACWNDDALPDLIVGQGGGASPGMVRVYLNTGTPDGPQFDTFAYAQADGTDLVETPGACQGTFPRVVDWNEDPQPDLLIGLADGTVKLYTNISTNGTPAFDAGTPLTYGPPGATAPLDVGERATPIHADWNNDGLQDLVIGAYDGRIHLFINTGTDYAPLYLSESFAQSADGNLIVDFVRSSPAVRDLDNDGLQDLLSGNTDGTLLLYPNQGTASDPWFDGYQPLHADGQPINLPGSARSRPFICDFNADGLLDLLVGAADGLVHLFPGTPAPGDIDADGDIDLADYALFEPCLAGPDTPPPAGQCTAEPTDATDLDGDADADLADFADFQAAFDTPA